MNLAGLLSERGGDIARAAYDGIAVIVNKNNTLDDITSDQVKDIYLGDVTSWDEL